MHVINTTVMQYHKNSFYWANYSTTKAEPCERLPNITITCRASLETISIAFLNISLLRSAPAMVGALWWTGGDVGIISTNNKLLLEKVINFWFCIVLYILLGSPFKKILVVPLKKMADIFFNGYTVRIVIKNGLVQSRRGFGIVWIDVV